MSNVLVDLSNQFAETVKNAGQSVVRVEGRRYGEDVFGGKGAPVEGGGKTAAGDGEMAA